MSQINASMVIYFFTEKEYVMYEQEQTVSLEELFGEYAHQISMEKQVLKMDGTGNHDIHNIMKDVMSQVKVNEQLVRDIDYYTNSYINKNEEHVSFFGSNLTGVNRIIFDSDDRNAWAIEILDIDEIEIKSRVRALEHIGKDWVRGTDGVNLSLIYTMHLLHHSTLNAKSKRKAIINCLIMLQAKFLSSLLYGYFKYPVSEKLALAVYDALSRKFYIKKYGTWFGILQARAESIYDFDHTATIVTFQTDERIQYMITDIQTRIKSMILNIYDVTMKLNAKGVGVSSKSMMQKMEGTLEVKTLERNFDAYLNYINQTMQEPRAFIKDEIVDIISDSITTMPKQLLYDVLLVVSEKAQTDDKKLNEKTKDILIYTFDHFRENKRSIENLSDLGKLVITLKSLFTASKTNSSTVIDLREYFDKMVKAHIKSRNPATIAGVRTGVVLYIILRTLTKSYYN